MRPVSWAFSLAWVWAVFVTVVAYAVYVPNYQNPPALYWDENYHVASAQKYLNGVFFMEPHPPLGKLLIALGEGVIRANPTDDQFIGTDYAFELPSDFSLAGYRLVPVLLAWLTAPLLYACFLLVIRNATFAGFLTFLYLFDNALIVHLRGAMLESSLLFFSTLTILAFLLAYRSRRQVARFGAIGALFGFAFACVTLTKENGFVLALLAPLLLIAVWPKVRVWLAFCLGAVPVFAIVFVTVWQIHFALGSRIIATLPNSGYYGASDEYRQILADAANGSLANFPAMLRDSFRFSVTYTQGVPRLDMSKPDENGSPFFFWPFGARSIQYLAVTQDSETRYLYLQVNPAVWFAALTGVLLAAAFVVHSVLVEADGDRHGQFLMGTFLALYVGYMVAVSRFDRVLYLYHYFLPLLFSFFLLGLAIDRVRKVGGHRIGEAGKTAGLFLLAALIVVGFRIYDPLTYYQPLTDDAVRARALFPLWELHCADCPRQSILVLYNKAS